MILKSIVFLAALFLIGCNSQQENAHQDVKRDKDSIEYYPSKVVQVPIVEDSIDVDYEDSSGADYRQLEKINLSKYSPLAIRSGNQLILTLRNNHKIVLSDTSIGDDYFENFIFIGHVEILPYFLIERAYNEHGDFLLVHDSTGVQYDIYAKPVISPDHKRIVIASLEGELVNYPPNSITIYIVEPDSLKLEWSITPEDWGASDATWIDNTTIRILKDRVGDYGDEEKQPLTLQLIEGKWGIK
jgi:hypothetical protein